MWCHRKTLILRLLKRGMEDIGEDRGGLFEKETDVRDIGKAILRLHYSYSRLGVSA